MPLTEQQVRQELAEAAGLAAAPRFTADDLMPRISRRRGRTKAAIAAGAAVIGTAIGVPVALGGASQPAGASHPSPPPPKLSYAVTVNGSTGTVRASWAPRRFAVTAGERLTITAILTVPPRTTATWTRLGITKGALGPATMYPVLRDSTGAPLGPGQYAFTLHWVVPSTLRPGSSRQLELSWSWPGRPGPVPGTGQVPGREDESIAVFAIGNGLTAVPQPSQAGQSSPG